jgi:hypothetical protein
MKRIVVLLLVALACTTSAAAQSIEGRIDVRSSFNYGGGSIHLEQAPIISYCVVGGLQNAKDFSDHVNAMLIQGWQPLGSALWVGAWYQTMVRYKKTLW